MSPGRLAGLPCDALNGRESMAGLQSLLESYVDNGSVPGAVGLVARGDRIEVAVAGTVAVDGAAMARDSIFRWPRLPSPSPPRRS